MDGRKGVALASPRRRDAPLGHSLLIRRPRHSSCQSRRSPSDLPVRRERCGLEYSLWWRRLGRALLQSTVLERERELRPARLRRCLRRRLSRCAVRVADAVRGRGILRRPARRCRCAPDAERPADRRCVLRWRHRSQRREAGVSRRTAVAPVPYPRLGSRSAARRTSWAAKIGSGRTRASFKRCETACLEQQGGPGVCRSERMRAICRSQSPRQNNQHANEGW